MDIPLTNETYVKNNLIAVISNNYGQDKIFNIYIKKEKSLTVPLIWGIKHFPSCDIPRFASNIVDIPDCKWEIRKEQKECIEKCSSIFSKIHGGGIINMHTGCGKTFCSLYLIGKFKYKTLIVVNTSELLEQWKDSINKFLPGVKVGIIKGPVCQKEFPICIAMINTLSMRDDYTKETFKDFSCVFIDECHHLSAEIFSKALWKIRSKYVFGLSATIERKDGMQKIFNWHCGDVIFSNIGHAKKQNTILDIVNYNGHTKEERMFNGNPKISSMITNISYDLLRNEIIVQKLLNLSVDRNVLVLSDRVSQLVILNKMLGDELSGLFTGKVKKEDKQISKTKKILLATYSIANEGFDHPKLNTLLFATPRSSITQSIGRIYRKHHETKPMIIDIVDQFSIFPYQYKKRKKIYKENINLEDENECLF